MTTWPCACDGHERAAPTTLLTRCPQCRAQVTEDVQCARCGSSVDWVDCLRCNGHGRYDDDRWEYEALEVECSDCRGTGGHWECLSDPEWCEANPLPGRDQTKRGEIEEYAVEIAQSSSAAEERQHG